MVSCVFIQAEKPLTPFSFFKANFVTLFNTVQAILVLLYRSDLAKVRAQILMIWNGMVRRVTQGLHNRPD